MTFMGVSIPLFYLNTIVSTSVIVREGKGLFDARLKWKQKKIFLVQKDGTVDPRSWGWAVSYFLLVVKQGAQAVSEESTEETHPRIIAKDQSAASNCSNLSSQQKRRRGADFSVSSSDERRGQM